MRQKSSKKYFILILFGVIFGSFFVTHKSAQAAGVLRVDPGNPRYLVKDGQPFFYQGDTAWALFYALTDAEIKQYLDERKARGFNVIQIFGVLEWSNVYGQINIVSNPAGHKPLLDNDAEKLNPLFWDRVGWILGEIRKRDMFAAVAVGGALRKEYSFFIPYTNHAKAYRYGYQLGLALRDYNDIMIWVGGQDMSFDIPEVNDLKINIRAEMEGVADAINGAASNYNKSADYTTTLMTYHPPGMVSASDHFQSEAWLDFNWIQTYGNLDQAPGAVSADRSLTPVKPTMLAEGAYEDTQPDVYINTTLRYRHYVPSQGKKMYYANEYGKILPWHIRYQAYQTVFSGAAGIGYGHRGHIQTIDYDWSRDKARNAAGAWDLKHLHDLMDSSDMRNFVPDQSLIVSTEGSFVDIETNMVVGMRTIDKTRAYFYTTRGRAFTVVLSKLSGTSVSARWLDPRTGNYTDSGIFSKTNKLFDPPGAIGNDNDWVLVLEAASAPDTALPAAPGGFSVR